MKYGPCSWCSGTGRNPYHPDHPCVFCKASGKKVVGRTRTEAIAALDAIVGDDPEEAHSDADRILLTAVPAEVREAYDRVVDRADAWWFA